MNSIFAFILAASALVFGSSAFAQFAKPEDAIKYRQSAMFIKNQHLGRIGQMVNGRIPFDAKAAQENGEVIAALSATNVLLPAYAAGTEGGKAKSNIWTDSAKFKELAETSAADGAKLLAALKTGNMESIRVAFGATVGTCRQCHDTFRN